MAPTLFGPIALTLGPVNLLPAMRQRRRWAVHRWLGQIYLIASIVLGLAGLSPSAHAFGNPGPRTESGCRCSSPRTRGQFVPAYRWASWLCWVPNAFVAEWMIRRGWRPQFVPPEGFA